MCVCVCLRGCQYEARNFCTMRVLDTVCAFGCFLCIGACVRVCLHDRLHLFDLTLSGQTISLRFVLVHFSLTNRSRRTATCTPHHKNRLLLYLCCRLLVSSLAYVCCQRNVQQRAPFKAALCFKCCSNLRVKSQNSHMKDYNQGQWWKQKNAQI